MDVLPDIVDLSAQPTPGTVTNVAGFTQMADDVRAVINFLHENEVVVNPDTGYGFYIDPVFQNTCTTPNPALAPEGLALSQAEMVDYLNALVFEAEAPIGDDHRCTGCRHHGDRRHVRLRGGR